MDKNHFIKFNTCIRIKPDPKRDDALKIAKRITKNVRLYFKDQTIRQIANCVNI